MSAPGGEKGADLQAAVAYHAGIRGLSPVIARHKVVNDAPPEGLPFIQEKKRDPKLLTDPAGVGGVLLGSAVIVHMDVGAGHLIPLLLQQYGGAGTVHAAAHGDQYLGMDHARSFHRAVKVKDFSHLTGKWYVLYNHTRESF